MELDAAREKRIKAVKACRDGDADDYELFVCLNLLHACRFMRLRRRSCLRPAELHV